MTVRRNPENLYIFTNSFPFGKGEQFFENELRDLAQAFNSIQLIPNSYGGDHHKRDIPYNVNVLHPIMPDSKWKAFCLEVFNWSPIAFIFDEIVRKRYYKKVKLILGCFMEGMRIRAYMGHPLIKKIWKSKNDAMVYSYWGYKSALITIFMPSSSIKKIVRFHGSDLYEGTKYLPTAFFREQMLKAVDQAIFVSNYGQQYLHSTYPTISFPSQVVRLGVDDFGLSAPNKEGKLTIASCSAITSIKRVHLIAEALELIGTQIEIEWTHLGDGPLAETVYSICKRLPPNINCIFPGIMPNKQLREWYVSKEIDLFINVSSSEGIPVSIMEAISAGIPVIATQVGGTSEIVDNELGYLIKPDFQPSELAALILQFNALPFPMKDAKRKSARAIWESRFNASKNNKQLISIMLKQGEPG